MSHRKETNDVGNRLVESNSATERSDEMQLTRRKLLSSAIGTLSFVAAACAREVERSGPKQTPGGNGGATTGGNNGQVPISTNAPVSTATSDPTVSVNCGCMPGGTPSTGAPTATRTGSASVFVGAQQYTYLGPSSTLSLATAEMRNAGAVTMSDGSVITVWGFTTGGGLIGFNNDRPIPSPTIVVTEGTSVALTLSSMHPHTIHLHGLDVSQANDGVPSTSGYVGSGMMGGSAPVGRVADYTSLGGTYTYQFIAPKAGTYMYHCHVDTVLHMEMGMYGTIVVRPTDGSGNQLWANGPIFNKEYIWQLHTVSSLWHTLEMSTAGITNRYQPDYFLINGRDGAQPIIDPTINITARLNEIVVIRLVNLGYLPALVKLGGIPFDVVASDGRPLKSTINGLTELLIQAGERYDVMFTMPSAGALALATVDYLTIGGTRVLGSASTTISLG